MANNKSSVENVAMLQVTVNDEQATQKFVEDKLAKFHELVSSSEELARKLVQPNKLLKASWAEVAS